LIDEIFAVRNFPYARATSLQCTAAFDMSKACNAASIRLILDAPSAFKVLNTQSLIATFVTLPVHNATILPFLLSGRVQSIDDGIEAFEAADEDVCGI
jgi:hypothetical protein